MLQNVVIVWCCRWRQQFAKKKQNGFFSTVLCFSFFHVTLCKCLFACIRVGMWLLVKRMRNLEYIVTTIAWIECVVLVLGMALYLRYIMSLLCDMRLNQNEGLIWGNKPLRNPNNHTLSGVIPLYFYKVF